jgi:hypothetical protein
MLPGWGAQVARGGGVEAHNVTFSSSPGFLASIDDLYLVKGAGGSDLAVQESSINIYNASLLDLIVPQSNLCWVRKRPMAYPR